MRPAPSIIFFTVTSGAGYGLFSAAALAWHASSESSMSSSAMITAGITSLVLVTLGLLSSTLHLANVKNAWRAFSRVSTSWLSREGVLALAFYPLAIAYLLGVHGAGGARGTGLALLAGLSVIVAVLTIYATGMIYACLRTVRQWHTPLTPLNYLGSAGLLGVLLLAVILSTRDANMPPGLVLIVILVALAVKLAWYLNAGAPRSLNLANATGFERRTVRLLDIGHTAGNFLTEEFCYELDRGRAWLLRGVAMAFAYVIPAIIALTASASVTALAIAAVLAYLGLLVERWLFFAEGQHVVALYHGADRA